MGKDHSFDLTSKANLPEVDNAINIAMKEIVNRFDLKGSGSVITREGEIIKIASSDEYKLKSVVEILKEKLIKRSVSLKFLDYGKVADAQAGTKKQDIKIKQGISSEQAKEIVKKIKDSKLKVQAAIQGDQIRVTSPKIDFLQEVIKLIRSANYAIELQFANYR